MPLRQVALTIHVGKGAEGPPRAVAGVLNVVALGRLVDLRVELLLCTRVAVLAVVAGVAGRRVAPLVARLDVRARRRPRVNFTNKFWS
jgi:hypothetical protein